MRYPNTPSEDPKIRQPLKYAKRMAALLAFPLLVVGACTLVAFSAAGCGSKTGKESDAFNIGAALPLSGAVAYYGDSAQKGITIALEEVNAAGGVLGGRTLAVTYEDTQGNAKGAAAGVRKLISVDRVPAIIGAGSSAESLAVVKIADENEVVLLTPISSSAELRGAGKYFFRSCPSDADQARMLARMVHDKGFGKVGVVFSNSIWGNSMKNNFVKEFTALGGAVLTQQSSEIDDKDFRTQLLNVKQSGPDALVAITYAKEGGRLMKQAAELPLGLQAFGADPWTIADFLTIAGPAAENAFYTAPGRYDGPEAKEFTAEFVARYQKEPDVYAYHGYDCLKLLANAINQGGKSGPEIQAALAATKDFPGVTGRTTFDEAHDVVGKDFVRMTIRGGKAVPASP